MWNMKKNQDSNTGIDDSTRARSARVLSIAGWKQQLTPLVRSKHQESAGCQDPTSRPRPWSTRPTRPARFSLAAFALLLLAAAALGAGCGIGSGQEETENGANEAIAVEVQAVAEGDLAAHVEISGEVDSDGNVALIPQVNGTVARIAASVGERVESGQVLLELENEDLATQLRQAESRLDQVRLQLAAAREVHLPRQLDRLESEVAQLAESLRQLEITYSDARRSFERTAELYQEEIISLHEYEKVEMELEMLESRVRQTRSQYESALRQLEMERVSQVRELAQLEAQLRDAQIGLDAARLAYEKTRLKAPVAGTVSSLNARLGQEVGPGVPLATLVDYDALYVRARITERQLELIATGDTVLIQVPTLGEEFPGTVQEIALAPQEGTRSYPVKVYFDQPAERARIGQLANLLLVTQEAREALVVPRRAIIEENGVFRAYVVEDGVARERLLELGLTREDAVEVREGLQQGEQLVIRGQQFLEDGSPVQIVGGEAS